jgi:hypothetical protein
VFKTPTRNEKKGGAGRRVPVSRLRLHLQTLTGACVCVCVGGGAGCNQHTALKIRATQTIRHFESKTGALQILSVIYYSKTCSVLCVARSVSPPPPLVGATSVMRNGARSFVFMRSIISLVINIYFLFCRTNSVRDLIFYMVNYGRVGKCVMRKSKSYAPSECLRLRAVLTFPLVDAFYLVNRLKERQSKR